MLLTTLHKHAVRPMITRAIRSTMRQPTLASVFAISPISPDDTVPAPSFGAILAARLATLHAVASLDLTHLPQGMSIGTKLRVHVGPFFCRHRSSILAPAHAIASHGGDNPTGLISTSTFTAQTAPAAALVSSAVDTSATRTL